MEARPRGNEGGQSGRWKVTLETVTVVLSAHEVKARESIKMENSNVVFCKNRCSIAAS